MEDEKNHEKTEYKNKIKQQITIPFQWEEQPGAPKKDWKPNPNPNSHLPNPIPLPKKYIASIPFKWEEKPGTPLRTFTRDPTNPRTRKLDPDNKNLPLPPAYFTMYKDNNNSSDESSYGDDYDFDDQNWVSEFESDSDSDSFCSAPSLLAKTPLQNPYIESRSENIDLFEDSFSIESRNGSLKGAEFLAHLFPLYPPKSGFLDQNKNPNEKIRVYEKKESINGDRKRSGVIRRPCSTLGELIMQSRRRSYRRKAVHMKKQNQTKNFAKNKPQGCFHIMTSSEGLAKMLRKDFLPLKLS